MINPNLLHEEFNILDMANSLDDFELEIEFKTTGCIWKSFEILDRTFFDEMYEWFYEEKNAFDKWEALSDSKLERISDMCSAIQLEAIIFNDLQR